MSAVGEFVEFVEAEPPFDPSDFRPRVLACCRLIHLRTHLASLNEEWHPRPSDSKNSTLANTDSTHNPVVLTTSSISAFVAFSPARAYRAWRTASWDLLATTLAGRLSPGTSCRIAIDH